MAASGVSANLFIVGRKLADNKFRLFDSYTVASGALADANERSVNDPTREYTVLNVDFTTVSGFLQNRIDEIDPSGVTIAQTIDIAQGRAITALASGIISQVSLLPPLGHYHNSSELILNDLFPAVEFPNGDDKFLSWNLITPRLINKNAEVVALAAASGLHIFFQWAALTTGSGSVKWKVELTPTEAGSNIDSLTVTEKEFLEPSQVYVQKDINLSVISVSGIDLGPAVQLRLRRVGSEDSLINTTYIFNTGVSYF